MSNYAYESGLQLRSIVMPDGVLELSLVEAAQTLGAKDGENTGQVYRLGVRSAGLEDA